MRKAEAPIFESGGTFSPRLIAHSFHLFEDERKHEAHDNLTCQWWHSRYDADIVIWTDDSGLRIRQHICIAGLTLDWDIVHGTRTGIVVDSETSALQHSVLGKVDYDESPSLATIEMALSMLSNVTVIEIEERAVLETYFRESWTYADLKNRGIVSESGTWWERIRTYITHHFLKPR